MKKQITAIIAAICMLLTVLPYTVMAADDTTVDIDYGTDMEDNMSFYRFSKSTSPYLQGYSNIQWLKCYGIPENTSRVRVLSSNSKVVSTHLVRWKKGDRMCYLQLKMNRPGTARIKVAATVNGKNKTVDTSLIKVYGYKNPVIGFKIDDRNYASRFNKTAGVYTVNKPVGKYKIYAKAASGWSIKELKTCVATSKDGYVEAVYHPLKNNSYLQLEQNQTIYIYLTLYNKSIKKQHTLVLKLK